MGYAGSLHPQIICPNVSFQFPLWDTLGKEVGIRFASLLSIPFMGYFFKI